MSEETPQSVSRRGFIKGVMVRDGEGIAALYIWFWSNGTEASAPVITPDEIARVSLSSSYLYVDDEGFTQWQGETSGLPILDLLIEHHHPKRA